MPVKQKARRATHKAKRTRARDVRGYLVALAVVRIGVGIIAIPLAPMLYKKHFLILALMRPTKEVLLFGGFLARQHRLNLFEVLVAAVPLAILGVWHSFALGRTHATDIRAGKLPGLGGRVLNVSKIKKMQKVLEKKGPKLVLIGRLAAFPSTVVGAAAGASKMETGKFLLADGLGGLLSIAEAAGAGFALGGAYKHGKHWLTFVGLGALAVFAVLVGRYLHRE